MRKLISVGIFLGFLAPVFVFAVNITVPSAPSSGYGLVSTTTGAYVYAPFSAIYPISVTANSSGINYSLLNMATSTGTVSSPLTGNFICVGTSCTLGIQAASASQNGYFASTDWSLLHTATTTAGTGLTYSGNAFNVNTIQSISRLSNLAADGFIKTSGLNGTLSIDGSTYLTGVFANYPITSTGDTLSLAFGTTTLNSWSQLQTLAGLRSTASSTIGNGTQAGGLTVSGGATTTGNLIVQGSATSTFTNGISGTYLNMTGSTASSTFANGIQLSKGCFAMPNGSCVGGSGTVTSVATTYPITGGPITTTGTLALAFGTTTANTWSLLNSFSNATSTLFTSTTSWIGTLNLTNALGLASGGTNATSCGTTGAVWYYDGTRFVCAANMTYSGSSTQLLTVTNASTTNISVNGNEMSGERYLTLQDSTSTAWTATSSRAQTVAPFKGSLSSISCTTATSSTDTTGTQTLNTQLKINGTNVAPMFNASTTKGTVTFTSGNTFSKGDIIQAFFGTPANTPTQISCTSIGTGY